MLAIQCCLIQSLKNILYCYWSWWHQDVPMVVVTAVRSGLPFRDLPSHWSAAHPGGRRGLGLTDLGASKEPAWEASEVGVRGETLTWANTGWIFIPSPRSLGSERWEGKVVPGLVLRWGVFAASIGQEERRTERQEEWQGDCVRSTREGDVIGDMGSSSGRGGRRGNVGGVSPGCHLEWGGLGTVQGRAWKHGAFWLRHVVGGFE